MLKRASMWVYCMISTRPLFRDGRYQTNLVEYKDLRGLTIRFHFEVIDQSNCKCIGIFDRVTDAQSAITKQAFQYRELSAIELFKSHSSG